MTSSSNTPNTPKSNSYLTKIINLLIKRENGMIRIPITDLISDDIGQGVQVHFDKGTKELVLSSIPAGARTYLIEEGSAWLTSEVLPQQKQEPHPLTREDLVSRIWTESGGTATLSEERRPQVPPQAKNRVVQLTQDGQAEAEIARQKRSLMKELESLQPPSPSQQPSNNPMERVTHSNQRMVFSKP